MRQPPLTLQQRGYQALLALALAHRGRRAAVLLQQRRRARAHTPLHLLEDRAGAEEVLAGERLVQLADLDAAQAPTPAAEPMNPGKLELEEVRSAQELRCTCSYSTFTRQKLAANARAGAAQYTPRTVLQPPAGEVAGALSLTHAPSQTLQSRNTCCSAPHTSTACPRTCAGGLAAHGAACEGSPLHRRAALEPLARTCYAGSKPRSG